MPRGWLSLLTIATLALAAGACGDDEGSVLAGTTASPEETTGLFAGTPGTLPEPLETIAVESGGRTWDLPAAVCLSADGDAAIVLAAAQQQAAAVRHLVGRLVSGWPTTTWAQAFDYQAYEQDLNRAGITALALADVVHEQEALLGAWEDWEQAYASPEEGWGAPNEISGRAEAWRAEAEMLAGAIADHCPG